MNIKELKTHVQNLDKEIIEILQKSGYDLELVDYDKEKSNESALFCTLHDIIGHCAYIHYIWNK